MPMKSISHYITMSDKLVRFSSECIFCGKRKYHYVNGEMSIVTSGDDIAIPCIYLLSKRQDFKEKYQEMKETLSK